MWIWEGHGSADNIPCNCKMTVRIISVPYDATGPSSRPCTSSAWTFPCAGHRLFATLGPPQSPFPALLQPQKLTSVDVPIQAVVFGQWDSPAGGWKAR